MKKKNRTDEASSCDWRGKVPKAGKSYGRSSVHKYSGSYKWKGVRIESYKSGGDDWGKIIRKTLIGEGVKTKSHVRYFEIAPGGRSSFEKHRHEHIVLGIRGNGKVRLGRKSLKVGFLDVVYVSPDTPHQFSNPFKEPFGFICVVPAKRDKPTIIAK